MGGACGVVDEEGVECCDEIGDVHAVERGGGAVVRKKTHLCSHVTSPMVKSAQLLSFLDRAATLVAVAAVLAHQARANAAADGLTAIHKHLSNRSAHLQ